VFLEAAHQGAKFVIKMQYKNSSDKNAVGGFFFWKNHPIMFSWATMFATSALHALDNVAQPDALDQTLLELY
jgi:hypothetical protein